VNVLSDAAANYERTGQLVGYVPRKLAAPEVYADLGFKSGLEIHQQLKTEKKLFCRCPAGIYQKDGEFDAEVIRHMRPTLSEMGEYDGTALMERKTRKNIIYRIKYETACTYEIDDTPPFPLNREALGIAIKIALMLNLNIVGELHITRKQYLDGSIPTGFQRTAIIGIEGDIALSNGPVRIIQLSVEEDACREVSDVGHWRVYTTDRLGMPLIETVTYPDMKTPDEVADAAHYLRFLTRSTGNVRTGIGAARQDVNVSIDGGTRVEIKGVAHIRSIPELVHNEAFRQKALLLIRDALRERVTDPSAWKASHIDLNFNNALSQYAPVREAKKQGQRLVAVNLPRFGGILSFFTQPGQSFADELSGRLKVIACLERPNMLQSEQTGEPLPALPPQALSQIREKLGARDGDAQVVVWGASDDVDTAIETIEERCRMAYEGVPNETRQALADGTTLFERVLPGPDRMYPDTDSAPIPVEQSHIDEQKRDLPTSVRNRTLQLEEWGVPRDTHHYILKRNLAGLISRIVEDLGYEAKFAGTVIGHTLRHLEGTVSPASPFDYERVYEVFAFVSARQLERRIIQEMLPVAYEHPNMVLDSALTTIQYKPMSWQEIISFAPSLDEKFREICRSRDPGAGARWIMGNLRRLAIGNVPMSDLRTYVENLTAHV